MWDTHICFDLSLCQTFMTKEVLDDDIILYEEEIEYIKIDLVWIQRRHTDPQ